MVRLLTVAVLASTILAAPASAKIKDWKITPTSKEAVLIMRADRQPFDYALTFSREGKSGFGSRVFVLGTNAYDVAPYTARTLGPGSYQLTSIVQQKAWASCFGSGSLAFTVEPGKVYYLGILNTMALLADLQQSAIARGKTSLSSGLLAVGWEPSVKPELVPPDEAELEIVRSFVSSRMPGTSAPVIAVQTRPITFGSSKGEKLIQVCG